MKMPYSYPVDLTIEYTNNTEYRECLRNLFKMNSENYPETENMDLDEETMDEMNYDYQSATVTMDFIFRTTKSIPEIMELYEKTASFMFSTDPNIGLTIMLGYDYLDLFHQLLQQIVSGTPTKELVQTDIYKQLHTKIYK